MSRLLAVHAHPDDETLSTGALLATWARSGEVELVTCTRGERGEVIGAALAHLEGDGPALAAHREGELALALERLGVQRHHFLDALDPALGRVEDSGMAWLAEGLAGSASTVPDGALVAADEDLAAGAIARLITDRRPQVVVTYGPDGGYGHPDHVRANQLTMRAIAQLESAGLDVPVVLWAVATPRTESVLASGGQLVVVDLAPVIDEIVGAMRAHATQVQDIAAGEGVVDFALSNEVPLRIGPVEVYEPAPGQGLGAAWPPGVRPVP